MANVKISNAPPVGLPLAFPITGPEYLPMDQTIGGITTTVKATAAAIASLTGAVYLTLPPYNCDPSGIIDCTSAFNGALQSGAKYIVGPYGNYKISGPLVCPTDDVTIWFFGFMNASAAWAASGGNNYILTMLGNRTFLYQPRFDGFYTGGTGPGCCLADGINVLGSRVTIWNPTGQHFPNTGLALDSALAGDSWIYQPFLTQISNGDIAFADDTSFTADALFINRADTAVIGGTARWAGIGIHLGNNAGTTVISDHHVYCGTNNVMGRTQGRIDPINMQIDAGANNIFVRDSYLDQGLINVYSPAASFRNCFVLQTANSALFTNATAVQVFANGQNQPLQTDYDFIPVGLASNNNPVNPNPTQLISYPGFGGNAWTGDWGGVSQILTSYKQRAMGSQGFVRIQHEEQLGGSPFNATPTVPMQADYKAANVLVYQYQIGTVVLGTSFPSFSYIGNMADGMIHQTNNVTVTSNLGLVTASITNFTLGTFALTGTGGQFSCGVAALVPGQCVYISGAFGGTGSITGYANPTAYLIGVTNGSTTGTLTDLSGNPIVTTAGTPAGLTYSVSTLVVTDRQSGSVETGYFVWSNAGGAPLAAPCKVVSGLGNASGGVGSYGLSTVGQTVVSGIVYLTIANSPTVTNLSIGTHAVRLQNDGTGKLIFVTADTSFWGMDALNGAFSPITDKTTNIGDITHRVNEIFLGAGGGVGTPTIRVDNSATTGAGTATFNATNKPGANKTSPDSWIPVTKDGTAGTVPWFAN